MRSVLARYFRLGQLAVGYVMAAIGSLFVVLIPRLRGSFDGADPNKASKRYAVYVTYDRHGLVGSHIVDQVAALAKLGYRVLVVSNSPTLVKTQIDKMGPYIWQVLHRRNFGHDFGAYKDGVRHIDRLSEMDALILMNDSCYGPLFDLAVVEERAQASDADIWGITDNWWTNFHLQSYYLRIGKRALGSAAFHNFWRAILPYQPRGLVIRNGEIRFTQYLLRRGMIADVLCPHHVVARRTLQLVQERLADETTHLLPEQKSYLELLAHQINRGIPLNSMHSFWDVLVSEFSCPFIKRDLLRRNPLRIPGLIEWNAVLHEHTDYDIQAILRHLMIG